MKTILLPEPGKVQIAEVEKPIPKEGEALLKLLYGGICGSDMHTYHGANAYVVYPCIPGHEFSAEIVEIGENDRGLREAICADMDALGIVMDNKVNAECPRGEACELTAEGSRARVFVIPTDEEYMIALDTLKIAAK